jgi:polyisoprenyl-teichoic acid--peptidoglycan teichoic acid transferase
VSGLLITVLLLSTAAIRLGIEWKRALDDVDAMIVTPVSLPEPTAMPALGEQAPGGATDGGRVTVARAEPTEEPAPPPEADDPINILLLGTDARADEDPTRTDAIILVHLNPRTNRVSLLSFPRDLWVEIPGVGYNRINAAYPIGERRMGPGYGAALAKETVSNLVGVPVHHFILINFEGFKTVIDRIGGITIDVPRPIDDPAYPMDEYPGDVRTMRVHFDRGEQLLDGERALIYARTRHADNDFGRNQRQQQVLMAIFNQVREQNLLTQLTQLDDYTGALRDYVRTDLPRSEMIRLAQAGSKLTAESVQRYAIDSKMIVALETPATFAADPVAVREIVDKMTAGGEPPGP